MVESGWDQNELKHETDLLHNIYEAHKNKQQQGSKRNENETKAA